MLIYFYLIFLLYFIFVCLLLIGWNSHCVFNAASVHYNFVSVVTVVRNEEKNILRLLESIARQTYPKDKYELIVIDDQSEDQTRDVVQQYIKQVPFRIRLMEIAAEVDHQQSPKMHALNSAIAAARGDIIVTTDGDCHMGPEWLKSMAAPFQHKKIHFISGPVALEAGHGIVSKIQSLEFASLIGSGAAMIQWAYPLMCNGANLAFRKSAFLEVNGYEGVYQSVTGDDVYLMQKIHKRYEKSISFAKDSDALVTTQTEATFGRLVQQRKRWASKWNRHLLPNSWAIPVFLFLHYFSFIALVVYVSSRPGIVHHGFLLIILKFACDFFFLKKVMDFCRMPVNVWVFLITEFIYPFYALSIGILVHFGGWTWKGRRY